MHARAIPALLLVCCTSTPGTTDADGPRSAEQHREVDPALPEARPSPFEVELRRRNGAESMLLRATDDELRFRVSRDPHELVVSMTPDPTALDALYAVLREQQVHEIEARPNPDAEVDGTSIRLRLGRRRLAALRIGQFEPKPEFTEAYETCVEAIEALIPGRDSDAQGVPLVVAFDASMDKHHATVEIDLERIVDLQSSPELTLRAVDSSPITLRLRVGPPLLELEQSVDLAQIGRVVIGVDPELGRPAMTLQPREG